MSLNHQKPSLVPKEALRSLGFQELVSLMRSAIPRIGKVGNGIALGTLLAVSACNPQDPQEHCKTPAACATDNNNQTPDDNTPTDTTTPDDTTTPTDDGNTDPTCPPDCPETPDTTNPKTPIFAEGVTQVTVGPTELSYPADVTIPENPDANMKEIRFQVDSETPTVIPYTGQTSITVDIPAGKTGTVTLADKAGNTASASLKVNVDATPPGTPSFSVGSAVTVGTAIDSVPVVLTIPTPLDTETVETKVDSGTWTPEAYNPGDSTLNLNVPAGHTLHARAKDKVDNVSGEDSVTVDIDNQGPLTPYPATATQITLGPAESSTPVTFTVPQPTETQKILASINGGTYAEVPYTAGASSVETNVNKGSSVKVKAVDANSNESTESAQVSVLAEQAPASAQLSKNFFQMGATTPTTFSFDVTPSATARKIVIVDGDNNEVFSSAVTPPSTLPVSMPNPGTSTTYTVYSIAQHGTQDATGTPLSVEIMPAPTITNLNNGCGGVFCNSNSLYFGTFDYSGTVTQATGWCETSGNATPGTITNIQLDGSGHGTYEYRSSWDGSGQFESCHLSLTGLFDNAVISETHPTL